jgi:ATP-dependent protease ClpP protease subunit
MSTVNSLTIDWNRAIIVDTIIDDDLVRHLTPKILSLRQDSKDPITVGIDSSGGSLTSLEVLLGLLTGPNQDGHNGEIITVATHKAYSAAANFLALGNYAVALPHAQVLYHDVRFGGLEDVTPEKARDAAKSLQDANYAFALRLAHHIIKRLVWIYVDINDKFINAQSRYPERFQNYTTLVDAYAPKVQGYECFDLAGFATTLWAKLSSQNDTLVDNVMIKLGLWINNTIVSSNVPTYRSDDQSVAGLLDGSRRLHELFSGKPEHFNSCEDGLKMILSLIAAEIAGTKTESILFPLVLERAVREYSIMESLNDPKHIQYASDLMLQRRPIFFGTKIASEWDKMPETERNEVITKSTPHARLFWHFCVLLCRELFTGEHVLKPQDAQLLGLVDEISGGGPIQSRRDFRISQEQAAVAESKSVTD